MTRIVHHDLFEALVRTLHEIPEPDSADLWPVAQMELLGEAGGHRWNIPAEFGGDGSDAGELLEIYRALAAGRLLTTFILTQRNAACQRIESSGNDSARQRWLPQLSGGRVFATVGISHFTTSRQHLSQPAVTAIEEEAGCFSLHGTIPWVTAARSANVIVTGGTLRDGRQILAAVPCDQPGVFIQPPIALLGLSSSQTSIVELHHVRVRAEDILHGPADRVISVSSGASAGAGSLSTSAVAIGAAQGTLRMFSNEVDQRPELADYLRPLLSEAAQLTDQLRDAVRGHVQAVDRLRQRANSLALRSAEAWLAATKGAGYVAGHPAERALRESLFFLVWSCPQHVLEGNLHELTCQTT
ncbi:MAG: acyl-CoA dehydrogenase family protein [Planctomycetota bacterium]